MASFLNLKLLYVLLDPASSNKPSGFLVDRITISRDAAVLDLKHLLVQMYKQKYPSITAESIQLWKVCHEGT